MRVDVQLDDSELALLAGYNRSTTMGIKKPGELQRGLLSDMENIEEKRMVSVPEVENASEDSKDDAPVRVRADFLSMLSELAKPDTNKAGIDEDEDGYEDDVDDEGGDDGGILPDDEDEDDDDGTLPDDDDDDEDDGDDGGILPDDDDEDDGDDGGILPDDAEEDDDDEDDWQDEVLPDDDEEDSQGIASEEETTGISLEDEDDSGELPEDEDEDDYELPEDEDEGDYELPEDEDEELSEDEDEGDYELPEDEDEDDYDSGELPADEDEDEDASGELPEDASEELPEDDVEEAPESTEEHIEPAPSRIAPVVAEKPVSSSRRQKIARPVSKQSAGQPAGYSTPSVSLYDFILSNGGSMLIEDVKKYYPIDEVKKALNLGKIYRFGNKVGV